MSEFNCYADLRDFPHHNKDGSVDYPIVTAHLLEVFYGYAGSVTLTAVQKDEIINHLDEHLYWK